MATASEAQKGRQAVAARDVEPGGSAVWVGGRGGARGKEDG